MGSGEGEFDPPFLAELLEVERDELGFVVGDNLFGNAKAADDILPDEVLDFSITELMVGLSLYPLGEVVCDCEHVHALAGTVGSFPTMSIPHIMKGHGERMGLSCSGGKWETKAKRWQLSQRLTWLVESKLMVGQ